MNSTTTPSVSIQIYGGNNQILPNATYAVQNFYGDELASQNTAGESSSPAPLSPPEQRLSILNILIMWTPFEGTSPSFRRAKPPKK